MIGASKIIRIIFSTLGIYLIAINVILWANSDGFGIFGYSTQQLDLSNATFQTFHNEYMTREFAPFSRFFELLSTFPGLNYTITCTSTYGNIISSFDFTGNAVLDTIVAIFRVLTLPIALSFTILADVFRDVMWFLRFVMYDAYFS